jgi:hypothetical protein
VESWGLGRGGRGLTLLGDVDVGAGAAGGVDGLLVLLGGGVGQLLAYDHGLPVLGDRPAAGHLAPPPRRGARAPAGLGFCGEVGDEEEWSVGANDRGWGGEWRRSRDSAGLEVEADGP